MNIVIAPDSYKGSISASEVGYIMERAILREVINTYYGLLGDEQTVVFEVANICGLTMVPEES